MKTQQVTINAEQELYVIPCGGGYTCLGFDVCAERTRKLAAELQNRGVHFAPYLTTAHKGSLDAYDFYQVLLALARKHHEATGYRFTYELCPQLVGLEGKRVEVVTAWGETERFYVGKSTGWVPCHLAIKTRRSSGGCAVTGDFQSVRVVGDR